jgi:hypothetical protein
MTSIKKQKKFKYNNKHPIMKNNIFTNKIFNDQYEKKLDYF